MATMNISNTAQSNYRGVVTDVTVPGMTVDSPSGQEETTYQNSDWGKWWGYFNQIPDLKSAITLKSTWVVGKGYSCDDYAKVIFDYISGWGKDSFQDIMFNLDITRRIGGDAFAEIIRDEKTGTLLNLKPLNPSTVKIIVNKKGIIKRYEVTAPSGETIKFQPKEIFHISNNRLADQIHGISDIAAVEEVIKADNELFVDTKKIMHCQARPLILWKLKTDDSTKIAAFVRKVELARKLSEDLIIPDDENIISHDVIQVSPNPMIIAWHDTLRNKFYRNIGLPQIVPGAGGSSTESESKVIYLAFEQIVQKEQLEWENAIWNQLQLRIKLTPPTSMSEQLQSDEGKDAGYQTAL
jgi:uncharacterized Zn finger protein